MLHRLRSLSGQGRLTWAPRPEGKAESRTCQVLGTENVQVLGRKDMQVLGWADVPVLDRGHASPRQGGHAGLRQGGRAGLRQGRRAGLRQGGLRINSRQTDAGKRSADACCCASMRRSVASADTIVMEGIRGRKGYN